MAKLKNKLNYILALAVSGLGISSTDAYADDEPKSTGSDKKAAKSASGGLSAGAIAAAVAAAAAIAAASDSGSSAPAPTPAPPPAPNPAPTPAPTVIEEYSTSTNIASAVVTYTNAASTGTVTATATREVAGTPVVTGIVTATATASGTSTSGGVLTDYRYSLYGTEGQTTELGAGSLEGGTYYIDSGDDDADGDDILYIEYEIETYPEVVITEAVPASVEEYVYDKVIPTSVTLPDTIYEVVPTGTTSTRTAEGS